MKLKRIIFILSFLAFLSAVLGGWLYFASLKAFTLKDAHHQAEVRVQMLSRQLSFFFSENAKPAKALAGMDEVRHALDFRAREAIRVLNAVLDNQAEALGLEAAYLMNAQGVTLASSNRGTVDSYVGKDFSFRPYFQQSMSGQPARFLALGASSGKRGAYCSHPVYADGGSKPVGVVALKVSIEQVERALFSGFHETVFVTAPFGLIFLTNKREFLYNLLDKPSPATLAEVAATTQFGDGPWEWSGLTPSGDRFLEDRVGRRFLVNRFPIAGFAGWEVLHLRDMAEISRQIYGPFLSASPLFLGMLVVCVGGLVLVLHGMASHEIRRRKDAEDALKESEERYRMIYHNTPAMLHSIDRDGRLIHVSDYWLEWTGYARGEVIGKKLTDFLTKESKHYAETQVFPKFFKQGSGRNTPYQFVRKNGEMIDILTSGYGVRNASGEVERSIAVSVDVTERNRARKELEEAKEKLHRLSGSILATQERERASIARELHVQLGQVLAALRMDAVWLEKRLSDKGERAAERVASMCSLIDQMIRDVRDMAYRLRPPILDELGLVAALGALTSAFEERTGITCGYEPSGMYEERVEISTAVYRIVEEALANVDRHANADRVDVALAVSDTAVVVTVSDNGRGFNPESLPEGGFGLAGMTERASLVGGRLVIRSKPGGGATVHCTIPL